MTTPEDRKSRSGALTVISLVATLAYLGILGFLAQRHWSNIRELSAEGLGSLLQGVFSPLAFYWLVVGYVLQRKELELQRHELRANNATQVEQQHAMSRQADLIAAQLRVATNQANSLLDMVLGYSYAYANGGVFLIGLKNYGANAYSVIVESNQPYKVIAQSTASHLLAGQSFEVAIDKVPPAGECVMLNFDFTRQDGMRRKMRYLLDPTNDHLVPTGGEDSRQ